MDNQIDEKFVDAFAEEYSNYFILDTTPQVKLIEECIEENLTHLEEFCTMIDLIRNESNGYLADLVPKSKEKRHQLRIVYDKIDKLLEVVEVVKNTIDLMENELNKAEIKFNSSSKLSRFFSSLIGSPMNETSNRQVDSEFQSPHIFKTTDYFLSHQNHSPIAQSSDKQNSDK